MASYRFCANNIATTYDFRIYGEQITMTDKQIIIEKIKDLKQTYEEIKENSNVFTSEFTLASGAITALDEVLEILNKEVADEK